MKPTPIWPPKGSLRELAIQYFFIGVGGHLASVFAERVLDPCIEHFFGKKPEEDKKPPEEDKKE